MKRYQIIGFCIITCFLAFSCVREDVDLSQCYRNLKIVLDWINSQPRNEQDSINIAINSVNFPEMDIKSDRYGTDVDLLPRTYDITGWETTPNVNVSGRTVSLATNPDGSPIDPITFSGGAVTATVDENIEFQTIVLPVRQQTRELVFRIKFLDDGLNLLDGLQGHTDGIAVTRDINAAFPPADGRVRPAAIKNSSVNFNFTKDANNEWFTAGKNLLGVDGDADQTLYLRLFYSTQDYSDISLDITSQLLGFHTVDIHEPWYIVLTLDLSITFEPVIIDWSSGSESWLDAE